GGGREGDGGHPRRCGGAGADARRLADVREADEPRVRQHAQLEAKASLLAWRAGLGTPGRLIGRSREVRVAAPAATAPRHHDPLAGTPEVAQGLAAVRVVDERAGRHAEDQVGAALAVLLLAA